MSDTQSYKTITFSRMELRAVQRGLEARVIECARNFQEMTGQGKVFEAEYWEEAGAAAQAALELVKA